MDLRNLAKLNELKRSRRAAVLLTNLADGNARIAVEGEHIGGMLGEAVTRAFRSGKSVHVKTEEGDYFVNVHLPPARIIVIGAVHISQAMTPIARIAGFDMEIIDPRTAFATADRFGEVKLHADWPETVFRDRPLDAWCAVAALTHDPKIDDFPLVEALRAGCFYVGALGSRKTHAKRRERLMSAGLNSAQIDRIAAPIGLDIGAASPAEIAVAVIAQIIEALRKREIGPAAQTQLHDA